MSIDERGIARLERLSFDAYNEADVLTTAIENYHKRTGHYSERVLVDQMLWYENHSHQARHHDSFIQHALNSRNESQQHCEEAFALVIICL